MVCPQGEIKMSVDIEMTELLGSEKIVYFNIGNNRCSAKVPPEFLSDGKLELAFNKEDLYLFDKATGERIS